MSSDHRRVLVTGGQGLVGMAIQEVVKCHPQQHMEFFFVNSKKCDLRNFQATTELFNEIKPTDVIHLAARVGGLFANMADNLGFFEDNLAINSNVIKNCHSHSVKNAVFCLSTCVFPADAPLPITEESLHAGPPHFSNEGYAYSKRMLECLVRYYRQAYGYKNWCCIIPTNIYGPFDNYNLKDGHVIPALIHKCCIAKDENKPFIVSGSGKPLRQFIYSEDLAKIVLRLLDDPHGRPDDKASVICCDTGCEVSIMELAERIKKAVGHPGELVLDTTRSDGIYRKTASNARLMEIMEEFEFTPFANGIEKSVEWFIKNIEVARK